MPAGRRCTRIRGYPTASSHRSQSSWHSRMERRKGIGLIPAFGSGTGAHLSVRVYEILDRHRDALPPASEQTDDDRVWRLAMHRMDLRRYSVAEVVDTDAEDTTDSASEQPARQVRLESDELEPDIKEMVEESSARFSAMDTRLGLLMWAFHVFKHREVEKYDPAGWQQRLDQVRAPAVGSPANDELDLSRGGPAIVVAVCVRDHWSELSREERDSCVEVVCSEVEQQADVWNLVARIQRHEMSADRPCGSVVSLLVDKQLSTAQQARVRRAFIAALTHPVDEVRWHAVWGVAWQLWSTDRQPGHAMRECTRRRSNTR